MGFEFIEFIGLGLEFGLFFLDDFRRGLGQEVFVAHFALGLAHFFAQFLQFPVQAVRLFGKVDDARQRHEDVHGVHHGLGRGGGRAAGGVAMEFLHPAQDFDGLPVAVEGLNGPGFRAVKEDLHLGGRGHVHFAPDIADGGEGGHDQVYFGFGPGVVESGVLYGVGRGHDAALGAGEFLPDFLGDEGHEGMQEAEHGAEHPEQNPLAAAAGGGVLFIVELGFDEFQVPVAELVPDKLVKHVGRLIEVVGVQGLAGLPDDLLKAAHDPGFHRG